MGSHYINSAPVPQIATGVTRIAEFASGVIELTKCNMIVNLSGSLIIYSQASENWVQLGSTEGMRILSMATGGEMASVNYDVAVSPFIGAVANKAQTLEVSVLSVCTGVGRLSVRLDGNTLIYEPVPPIVGGIMRGCIPAESLSVMPMRGDTVPTRFTPDGQFADTISARFRPLFSSDLDYMTYLWLIGDSFLDPRDNARFLILQGEGNNGKSSLINDTGEPQGVQVRAGLAQDRAGGERERRPGGRPRSSHCRLPGCSRCTGW